MACIPVTMYFLKWLGLKDLNLHRTASETVALPLCETPEYRRFDQAGSTEAFVGSLPLARTSGCSPWLRSTLIRLTVGGTRQNTREQ